MPRHFGLLFVLVGLLLGVAGHATSADDFGIDAKKPVFGGACKICPWGAAGTYVKKAMAQYGYDVQLCYNCSTDAAPRLVAGRKTPPPVEKSWERDPEMRLYIPRPPDAPIDFGAVGVGFLRDAYRGAGNYAKDGPYKNLRLIAKIQSPVYLVVAVRKGLDITDLSQIKKARWPIKIRFGFGAEVNEVLEYYGLTRDEVVAAGGTIEPAFGHELTADFDVLLGEADFTTAPEFRYWNEVSQKVDLTYLKLPDDLLAKMAKEGELTRVDLPIGFLRGVTEPIPTVAISGIAIYGRDDMPDTFAYDVAKALDQQQQLLQWSQLKLSYNIHDVWNAFDVPLHSGAERYYREVGYLK
jgi:uncharacterized protein